MKDGINIAKGYKFILLVIAIYTAISFTGGDTSFFASMFTMVFALYVLNTYSYDSAANWDMYALTMPISRKTMVQSKYIFMLILAVISSAICFVMTIIINILLGKPVLLGAEYIIIAIATVMFAYSVIIPLVTKLSVEKARIVLAIIIIAPYAAISYVMTALKENDQLTVPVIFLDLGSFLYKYIYLAVPIVLACLLYISYVISVRIYEKKEF